MSSRIVLNAWNVPYQRNPFFTGREDVLKQLHKALRADNAVALSHPQGISGLGGIGKTQTALEYAYRYRAEYQGVLWVRADSMTTLTASFVELAQVLKLPERNEQDQNVIVAAVQRWLSRQTSYLLVFDNMDDVEIAEPFLPKTGPGHIIFTTRARSLAGIAQRLDVQKMEPDTGALLLLRRASILPLQAILNIASKEDRVVACEISQVLDGLPLALDQAGAYVKEETCSLRHYLERYQTRRQELLHTRGDFSEHYPASVATTWSLSFEKIKQADPAAAELLNFCAFLAPDAIPENIITEGATHLGPILAPLVNNPLQLDRVCKDVLRYSLFQRETDEHILTIHRLVQAVLQDNLPAETYMEWQQRAVLAVKAVGPDVQNVEQWEICERWVPHALVCQIWINQQEKLASKESALLLNRAGCYLSERGRYQEAEPLLKQSLTIGEQQLEPESSEMTIILNNLAGLYESLGKYEEAKPLYTRALTICESQGGPEHPLTIISLNNLAVLHESHGKYEEAEPLLQRVLALKEQLLAPDHPGLMPSLNNLAALYKSQGRYREAEPLLKRSLAIGEQQSGPEYPDKANTLHNLAAVYERLGRYGEAESLFQRSLAICEQYVGREHPDTVHNLNNLALLYKTRGQYREAEPLLKQVLTIYEQQLGAEHPLTALGLNNLALLYLELDKYREAEPLLRRSLAICEHKLGPDHPHTATSLNNLAALYQKLGKYRETEPLLQRSLAICEQKLGPDHPDTMSTLDKLADLYQARGKYKKAESLLKHVLATHERQSGLEHPHTITALNNLALFYHAEGKLALAEPLYKRALATSEQTLGREHPTTQNVHTNYSALLQKKRRYF